MDILPGLIRDEVWMSGPEITFRHMVTKQLGAVDFVLSNKPRERVLNLEDLREHWNWILSDHRPICYSINVPY